MSKVTARCALCAAPFEPSNARHIHCGRPCSQAARAGLDAPVRCADCNKCMELGRSSRLDGTGRCLSCRKSDPTHGIGRYRTGCRCEVCKAASAAAARKFGEKYRSEHGVAYATTWKRKVRDETGYWPNESGGWISRRKRGAIYERDGWMCHICGDPVSREYDPHDPFSPTLDHLIPRAAGGTHDPSNLATCHAVCNSRRGTRPLAGLEV